MAGANQMASNNENDPPLQTASVYNSVYRPVKNVLEAATAELAIAAMAGVAQLGKRAPLWARRSFVASKVPGNLVSRYVNEGLLEGRVVNGRMHGD